MTAARNRIFRSLRMAVVAAAPGSICIATPALADTVMGAKASAGASVDSNPYLTNGGGGTDVAGTLQIEPWLRVADDISSLDLYSSVLVRQFAHRENGTDTSANVSVTGRHQLSPFVSVFAGANYSTSRNGINVGLINVGPDDPLPPPTTPLPDITLGGTRTRTQVASVNAGLSFRLSPLDQLSASFTASRSTNDSPAGRDFTFVNTSLNYSRTLTERISATASIRYGKANYFHSAFGDGTTITPEVGVDMRLSPAITFSGSLGVSYSRTAAGNGFTLKSTSLSGRAHVCYNQERGAMCLVAERSSQPTALGVIRSVTSIAFNYDKRLSAKDSIKFGLSYNSTGEPAGIVVGPETSQYYVASADWSHSFNRRLSCYVSPGYSRIKNSSRSYDSFRVSAGVRYIFGAIS